MAFDGVPMIKCESCGKLIPETRDGLCVKCRYRGGDWVGHRREKDCVEHMADSMEGQRIREGFEMVNQDDIYHELD